MGRLADLQAQIEAQVSGREIVTPESRADDHVKAIVDAIQGIQLNIEAQEGYDYTPEFQRLGEAVTRALKAHGGDLVKAVKGLTVNVEAPTVNVAAPNVTVNPEIEIDIPKPEPVSFEVRRDENGLLQSVVVRPYEPEAKPVNRVDME